VSPAVSDSEIKARHRAMWASGDYPSMVETFLLPLGPRLVDAIGIRSGLDVLDVAAGTGNASLPAAERGATVVASDLTPELLDAGRGRAAAAGLELSWIEADAEHLPFPDESFDVVMSAIGAMFAPHHREVASELVRVCRPGGTIGLLSWTPEGTIGGLFRTMGPFAPPPPPGAQPPPLWGSEAHLHELLHDHVTFGTLERGRLTVDACPSVGPRRALQGPLRPDDRGACQCGQERPRAGVRGRARPVLRRTERRNPRRRPVRAGVPAGGGDADVMVGLRLRRLS
jgi:SAM-dependent methyltransferase